MTQKRFIKLCMSIGIPRNSARKITKGVIDENKWRMRHNIVLKNFPKEHSYSNIRFEMTTYQSRFEKEKEFIQYWGIKPALDLSDYE